MTEDELKTLIDVYSTMNLRLERIEKQLFNKLEISRIMDISDDKVHKVMQVVKMWETADGVVIYVK